MLSELELARVWRAEPSTGWRVLQEPAPDGPYSRCFVVCFPASHSASLSERPREGQGPEDRGPGSSVILLLPTCDLERLLTLSEPQFACQ